LPLLKFQPSYKPRAHRMVRRSIIHALFHGIFNRRSFSLRTKQAFIIYLNASIWLCHTAVYSERSNLSVNFARTFRRTQ